MKIQYYQAGKNDIQLLAHLAPPEQLDKLSLAKHIGIYAVDADEVAAVALMICSYARDKRLDIEWLYVDEAYRYQEIGGTLLNEAYQMAGKLELPYVGVWLTGKLATDANASVAGTYLNERGFLSGMYVEGDWVISSQELKKSVLGSDKYKNARVFSLDKVSSADLRQFLKENRAVLEHAPMYTAEHALADADPHLSMVYCGEDGQIEAVLLLQKAENLIVPLAMHMRNVSNEVFLGLAAGAVYAIRRLPEETTSRIVYSERSSTLMAMIFKNLSAEPTYLFLADASYDGWADDPEEAEPIAFANPLAPMTFPEAYEFKGYETYGDQLY